MVESDINVARTRYAEARSARAHSVGKAEERLRHLSDKLRATLSGSMLTRSVMVVDRDDLARSRLAACVTQALAMRVYSASNADDAIATFRAHRPAVLVLDYDLGDGLSGVDVARSIGRGPRVLIFSDTVPAIVLEEAARSIHAVSLRKSDTAGVIAAVRMLLLDAMPDTHTSEQLYAALDASHTPMTLLLAVRNEQHAVVDTVWRHVNPAARASTAGEVGARLSNIAPDFMQTDAWPHFIASFEGRVPWTGEVTYRNTTWGVRLVPIGGDMTVMSAEPRT